MTGRMLCAAFEDSWMETGLGGQIFLRSYEKLKTLASHSWMANLWHLLSHHEVSLEIDSSFDKPNIHEGDCTIMDAVIAVSIFDPNQLEQINQVRKYLKVHLLSDITCLDGCRIHPRALNRTPLDSLHHYPREQPTRPDFALWEHAIFSISSHSYNLSAALGSFLCPPPIVLRWFVSPDCLHLYHQTEYNTISLFLPTPSSRPTHCGTRYTFS